MHSHRETAGLCVPIINADESNEALRIVAHIRGHTGSDTMADISGLEMRFEKR
jgi:hypothetical protein